MNCKYTQNKPNKGNLYRENLSKRCFSPFMRMPYGRMQANLTVGLCNSFCMNRHVRWPIGVFGVLPYCEFMSGYKTTKNGAFARFMRHNAWLKNKEYAYKLMHL